VQCIQLPWYSISTSIDVHGACSRVKEIPIEPVVPTMELIFAICHGDSVQQHTAQVGTRARGSKNKTVARGNISPSLPPSLPFLLSLFMCLCACVCVRAHPA